MRQISDQDFLEAFLSMRPGLQWERLGCSDSFGGVEEEDPVSCNQEVRSARGDFGYD